MGLRDMYSAISGLEANSTWLDVIGNNISNTVLLTKLFPVSLSLKSRHLVF